MATWRWGNPLGNNFRNEPQEGFNEVTPDAGRPYRRQAFTDIYDVVSCSFRVTRQEYTSFMSWYNRDIAQGSVPFDFYDCRIDETRTARIVGKPQYNATSIYFDITVVLALDPFIRIVDMVLETEDGKLITTEDGKLILVPIKEQL